MIRRFAFVMAFAAAAFSAPGLAAQGISGPCASQAAGRYFVDSVRIPERGTLYAGYPKDETMLPGGFLLLSTKDSCIMLPDVITCDECIGRSTTGSTYRGASLKGKTVVVKQHTFDYDVEIYISTAGKIPTYEKVIVKTLKNKCVRTCMPKRALPLTELGFMSLDMSDKSLGRYFKVTKKGC